MHFPQLDQAIRDLQIMVNTIPQDKEALDRTYFFNLSLKMLEILLRQL